MPPANGRGELGIFITILPSTELRRRHNSYIITLPPPERRGAALRLIRSPVVSSRATETPAAAQRVIIHNFISLRASPKQRFAFEKIYRFTPTEPGNAPMIFDGEMFSFNSALYLYLVLTGEQGKTLFEYVYLESGKQNALAM